MNMKIITLILGLLVSNAVLANELEIWLKENNPNGYFPNSADYLSFPSACNENTCFSIVVVSYVTATNKGMRRVAVFSSPNVYLGVYSGFQEAPIKVSGSKLVFPESPFGNTIDFNGHQPPGTAYIDGEHFEFEPQP